MSKTYILFDLDGTLTDPKTGITKSVQYALNYFGINNVNPDDLCHFIGPPLRESFRKYYGFDDVRAEEAVAKYREYFAETGIYENAVYDGVEDMLQKMTSAGKTVILATSKPAVYAEKILKHFNLYDYFTFISGSELDGRRSKKGEVIQYAFDQNGITDLKDAVMVGDREHDILGAKEIGIFSIGVLFGYGDYDELYRAGANMIVRDPKELTEKLLIL